MANEADPVAQARRVYHQLQDEHLAQSPLGGAAEWVRTGRPPSAGQLRDQGYFHGAPRGFTGLIEKSFNRSFGFSIPCLEAVQRLVDLSPLVEIGAGTGFWSTLLRSAGADILATDIIAEGSPGYGMTVGTHCQITAMSARTAILTYPDRNVFCSWPSRDEEWCAEAAREIQPGRVFALIGRPRGGTTGSSSLFDLLEAQFTCRETVEIPQFPSQDDDLRIYRRT
ncbi:MAG: hypothetical protein ACXWKO_15910 [Phenylobacterium sp.]